VRFEDAFPFEKPRIALPCKSFSNEEKGPKATELKGELFAKFDIRIFRDFFSKLSAVLPPDNPRDLRKKPELLYG